MNTCHHTDGLRRQHSGTIRVRARATSRAAGGQAAWSGGDENLPVRHREPALPRIGSRYDLCYAVNQLTRACSKPTEIHMTAAKHALRYLRGTTDLPIVYKRGHFRMVSYTDASFGANPVQQRRGKDTSISLRVRCRRTESDRAGARLHGRP